MYSPGNPVEVRIEPKKVDNPDAENVTKWKGRAVVLAVVSVFLLCTTIALAVALGVTYSQKDDDPVCGAEIRSSFQDTTITLSESELRGSIFNDLTSEEVQDITAALLANSSLGLVPALGTTVDTNYIAFMERFAPKKADALAYLDDTTGTVAAPERYARVLVHRGADPVPIAVEYKVGPLPLTAASEVHLYKTVPFSKRILDGIEYDQLDVFIYAFGADVSNITLESYGATYTEDCEVCLTYTDTAPRAWVAGERKTWFWFMLDTPGFYSHPVGLEFRVDHNGTDVSQWKVDGVVYNHMFFDDLASFKSAYENGGVTKYTLEWDDELRKATTFQRRGTPAPLEHLPPPTLVEPAGSRYVIEGSHVHYLDWSFQIAVRQTCGPQLWDIRYKGERIVYELSLQEAEAAYGGASVISANSIYADAAWGMGRSLYEQLPGADCPATGKLLDLVQYDSASPTNITRFRNAICVFENNANIPIRRHYDTDGEGGFYFVSSAPQTHLVVRVVATVYNYDYIYDFVLHLNGVIEAKVHASGYLQAVPYLQQNKTDTERYGLRVLNYTAGGVHDHIVHYKIDLDIKGTANTPVLWHIDTENISLPYFPSEFQQRYITPEPILSEASARIKANAMRPAYWTLQNKNSLNKWGVPRSYRIMPLGTATTVLPNFEPYNFVAWTKYNLAFTRYHDDEWYSTTNYDQEDPFHEETFSFDDLFADDESLDDVDVVAWASIGMHHIPHAEDIPVTTTPGNGATLIIRPFNYFDEDASMHLQNSYLVLPADPEEGRSENEITYGTGGPAPACATQEEAVTYDGVLASE